MKLGILAQDAKCNAAVALAAGGTMVMLAGDVAIVSLRLSTPAFGPATAGSATAFGHRGGAIGLDDPLEARAVQDGNLDAFEVRTAGGELAWGGTVGRVGTKAPGKRAWDLELAETSIRMDQRVELTLWTYTQPAEAT